MIKGLLIFLGLLIPAKAIFAETINVTVGETELVMTIPEGFQEISQIDPDVWKIMETGTVANNRLLGVFLTDEDVSNIRNGKPLLMDRYLLLRTYRPTENDEINIDEFQDTIVTPLKRDLEKILLSPASSKQAEEALDNAIRQVKEDYGISVEMSDGDFKLEGILFEIPAAIGIAGIEKYEIESEGLREENTGISAVNYILTNHKLLYAYVVKSYKNNNDLNWVRNISRKWSESIIASKLVEDKSSRIESW